MVGIVLRPKDVRFRLLFALANAHMAESAISPVDCDPLRLVKRAPRVLGEHLVLSQARVLEEKLPKNKMADLDVGLCLLPMVRKHEQRVVVLRHRRVISASAQASPWLNRSHAPPS